MEAKKEVRIFHSIVIFGMRLLDRYLKEKVKEFKTMAENPQEVFTILRKENLALLERESYHIHQTLEQIEKFDISKFDTPEEYREALKKQIKDFYISQGTPPACIYIFEEKINACWEFFENFHKIMLL